MDTQRELTTAFEHHKSGRLTQAESIYRQILDRQPNDANALHLLGALMCQMGRTESGLESMRKAISIDPTRAEFHNNLGLALAELGRLDDAIKVFQKAIAARPTYPNAHLSLGNAFFFTGRFPEATECFRAACLLDPQSPIAHWNYAHQLLLSGDFERGLEEFEWRLLHPGLNVRRDFPQNQWNGSDISGKTLLVHAEGGFGDAIQFVRFLPLIRNTGARLIFECQRSLIPLLQPIPGVEQVIARGDVLPSFDVHIPLPGLMRILKIRLDNIPNSVPYISPPPDRIDLWRSRVPADGPLNIGLAWAPGEWKKGDNRCRSLQAFAPLAQLDGARFFSLQIGPESKQTPPKGLPLEDLTADIRDFADTAALIHHLDLVITVDTSVCHLAGALAKPVWVLLPFPSEFRWLLNRDDSPWYPTMRLFRQLTPGDWDPPVTKMFHALRQGSLKGR